MGLILLINVDKYVDKEFRRFSIVEKIVNYYSSFDEWRRLDREPIEFIVNSHYIKKFLPANGRILGHADGNPPRFNGGDESPLCPFVGWQGQNHAPS
jgi:hypothetical protein